MITVLVCGGRNYNDVPKVYQILDTVESEHGIKLLIEGGATGADAIARRWCTYTGTENLTYKADWTKHGNSAGPIRNKQMLVEGKPDLVVAFPGGRGTAHMKRIAREAGVQVLEA